MHTKDTVLYQGGHREVVEHVDEFLPQLHVVAPFAFVQESINLGDILILVVASQ